MSLAEVIAWGPLGPGGDPAMSLQGSHAPVRSLRVGDKFQRVTERREHYRQLRGTRSTRMGEAIRWAPLGPGGDPQMSLQGLGVLAPAHDQELTAIMGQLETTDQQVYNEIAEAYAAGASDSEVELYQDAYDRLLGRLIDAQTASRGMEDDAFPAFRSELGYLQNDYEGLLGQLLTAREKRRFGNRATGLAWGVGASVAAAGLLWVVWANRKKGRR